MSMNPYPQQTAGPNRGSKTVNPTVALVCIVTPLIPIGLLYYALKVRTYLFFFKKKYILLSM